MPIVIKTIDGKVVMRGGSPSCTCCGQECTMEFVFATYGPLYLTYDTVTATGSVAAGFFIGTNILGDFTMEWDGAQWIIFFDVTTPASGTGVLPNHERLDGGSVVEADPSGDYIEDGGAPFPNWVCTVTLI